MIVLLVLQCISMYFSFWIGANGINFYLPETSWHINKISTTSPVEMGYVKHYQLSYFDKPQLFFIGVRTWSYIIVFILLCRSRHTRNFTYKSSPKSSFSRPRNWVYIVVTFGAFSNDTFIIINTKVEWKHWWNLLVCMSTYADMADYDITIHLITPFALFSKDLKNIYPY